MALSELQCSVCKIIADNRRASGESYLGGDAALNMLTGASRISRDVDLFHDSTEALNAT